MSSSILVVGIGNEYRSDDGFGLAVARELRAKHLLGTLVTESSGEGASLMEAWEGAGAVILIDAVSSGAQAGTIYRFDAHAQPIPACYSFQSTHNFGMGEVLVLANALDQLPRYLIVYAIEGKSFATGVGLSPEVANAVRAVVEQVSCEIKHMLNEAQKVRQTHGEFRFHS